MTKPLASRKAAGSKQPISQTLGLNDPRLRRNVQEGSARQTVGPGLKIDGHGRTTISLTGALTTDSVGNLKLLLSAPLVETPGSPISVTIQMDSSLEVVRGLLKAVPPISNVRNEPIVTGFPEQRMDQVVVHQRKLEEGDREDIDRIDFRDLPAERRRRIENVRGLQSWNFAGELMRRRAYR